VGLLVGVGDVAGHLLHHGAVGQKAKKTWGFVAWLHLKAGKVNGAPI
jgi:hypothetical protein